MGVKVAFADKVTSLSKTKSLYKDIYTHVDTVKIQHYGITDIYLHLNVPLTGITNRIYGLINTRAHVKNCIGIVICVKSE